MHEGEARQGDISRPESRVLYRSARAEPAGDYPAGDIFPRALLVTSVAPTVDPVNATKGNFRSFDRPRVI